MNASAEHADPGCVNDGGRTGGGGRAGTSSTGAAAESRWSHLLLAAVALAVLLLLFPSPLRDGPPPDEPPAAREFAALNAQEAAPSRLSPGSPTTSTAPATAAASEPATAPLVRRDARGVLVWPRPRFAGRQAERDAMVAQQIARGFDRIPVKDPRVLDALRAVPRHEFVPVAEQALAYADRPLPIGHDQTISQPYIVALMTELLAVQPGQRILEIGTGSGYQAAVLAELTPYVYSIEIVEPLATAARERLERLGYRTVQVRAGDGYQGWPEHAPFDGVIVTCAPDAVPAPLWEQLAPGGRIVIPLGRPWSDQRLVVLTKRPDGSRESREVLPVRFVPMTGEAEQP